MTVLDIWLGTLLVCFGVIVFTNVARINRIAWRYRVGMSGLDDSMSSTDRSKIRKYNRYLIYSVLFFIFVVIISLRWKLEINALY